MPPVRAHIILAASSGKHRL